LLDNGSVNVYAATETDNSGGIVRDDTCNNRRAVGGGVFYMVCPDAIYRDLNGTEPVVLMALQMNVSGTFQEDLLST
jgi:hypothetical protein